MAMWHSNWMVRLTAVMGVSAIAAIAPLLQRTGFAQTSGPGVITLRADVQEANAITGIITARGNVQIDYPTRSIYATSAQAQYFSNERRIILSGNVVILQAGNRLEAENVTYLIDEGRFIALPQPNQQVKTTYILEDPGAAQTNPGSPPPASTPPPTETPAPIAPDAVLDISPLDAAVK